MGTILRMVLFLFLGYMLVSIALSFKQIKKMQDQSMEEYQAKQDKFKNITSELLDETEDDEGSVWGSGQYYIG